MAKIHEEIVVLRLSKLIKSDEEDTSSFLNKDFSANLEDIVQELVGESILVEIERKEK
jgi:hypothetical protein